VPGASLHTRWVSTANRCAVTDSCPIPCQNVRGKGWSNLASVHATCVIRCGWSSASQILAQMDFVFTHVVVCFRDCKRFYIIGELR
jgi:hypothetical protein